MNDKNSKRRKIYFLAGYIFLIIVNVIILVLGAILAWHIIRAI